MPLKLGLTDFSMRPMAEETQLVSKTKRKKAMLDLQQLGAQLLKLNSAQLQSLRLPENLGAAIDEAKRTTTHEAQRRQLQYIGRLMRSVDGAAIRAGLDALLAPARQSVAHLHHAERWRERMLESDEAIDQLLLDYPSADARQLRDLVRAARDEQARGNRARHYRELFRAVHDLMNTSPDSQ
jgi:ribosome-associated protein